MNFFNNNIINIILSLTLVYALLSILVSVLMEWWNYAAKQRSKMLEGAIKKFLCDPLNLNYGDMFYDHFMINNLKQSHGKKRKPQYISSSMFADVFIDIISQQVLHNKKIVQNGLNDVSKHYKLEEINVPSSLNERFELALSQMRPSPFGDALHSLWDRADRDVNKLKPLIEHWFNDYMDRVSGWYKNQQRKKAFAFGFIVAIALNIDSMHLLKSLSLDSKLTSNLVAVSENVALHYSQLADSARDDNSKLISVVSVSISDSILKDSAKVRVESLAGKLAKTPYGDKAKAMLKNDSLSKIYLAQADSIMAIVSDLNIPIGWKPETAPLSWFKSREKQALSGHIAGLAKYNYERNVCPNAWSIFVYFIGIIISGISLSFGAPFWFEMLVKLVNIRRAGKTPTK